MPTKTKPTATSAPATPVATEPPSKSSLVLKLLSRAKGATIAEMEEPTGWQAHSTRAFLSGLRKKGRAIIREPRKTGETAYRIVDAGPLALVPAALSAPSSEPAPGVAENADTISPATA